MWAHRQHHCRGRREGLHSLDHVVEGDVGEHVGVVREEHLLVGDEVPGQPQPLPDRGVHAGVEVFDVPVAGPRMVRDHQAHRVLDLVGGVTEAQHEIGVAVGGVVAHDVHHQR